MSQQQRQLACGTLATDLLEQVAESDVGVQTPHQTVCPFCQTTLRQLGHSWEAVRRMRSEEMLPPPRLVASVMRRVRAGLEDWRVQVRGNRGVTSVSRRVLALIAYEAASAVAGVHDVRQCRPRRRAESVADQVEVDLDLELIVAYGSRAPDVGEAVRAEVSARIQELTGLVVGAVQVTVTDVSVAEFGDPVPTAKPWGQTGV